MPRLATAFTIGLLLVALTAPPASAQTWREQADARIDEHRKADLTVHVRDGSGAPIAGADVHVEMTRHAFGFGTAINARYLGDGAVMDRRGSRLDLGRHPVGFRFPLDLPAGATVSAAYLQFASAAEEQEAETAVEIRAEASTDAPNFRATDLSSRTYLPETVEWTIPAWPEDGPAGEDQRTPDLSALVQAVVNQPGWTSGGHVVFALTGEGRRRVRAFRAFPGEAARLTVVVGDDTLTAQIAHIADDAAETDTAENKATYQEKLLSLFNSTVFENAAKWHWWDRDRYEALDAADWLEERGLSMRGHTLVWNTNALPPRIAANLHDPTYVRNELDAFIADIVPTFAGRLTAWDALNEVYSQPLLPDHFGTEEYVHWTQLAHSLDPDTPLAINQYCVLEGCAWYQEYRDFTQDLLSAGAVLHEIGMQGHFWSSPVGPETLWERLEVLAETGLALTITEFDMNIAWSQEQQAEQFEHLLVTFFSHPQAISFKMWGFWDADHWRNNSPLFAHDWTLKPPGQVWMDLVHDAWWTDEAVTSGAAGEALVRGFLGEYAITVTHDGVVTTATATLEAEGTEVVVTLGASSAEDDAVGAGPLLSLNGAFPNPAAGEATLAFALGADAEVQVTLYDVLGRRVLATAAHPLPQGDGRTLAVDVSGLAPGTYVYTVEAVGRSGTDVASGRLVVVR